MNSVEPSSGSGVVGVEQTIKDAISSDDKLSAASLQNLTLRSDTILDCSTEKVVRSRKKFLAIRWIKKSFQLDDSGDSEKHMVGDDPSGPNALDLNSLLKNLESEILVNEQNLNDENDKRYMFKV